MFLKSLRGLFSFATRPVGVLWDGDAAPAGSAASGSTSSGSGAAGAAGSSSTSSGNGSTGTPGTGASGTPTGQNAGQAGTDGAAARPSFNYQEDRSRWIPPHRLVEETSKRDELRTQLAERDRQIAALTGVSRPDPNTQEAERIREAFYALPGMAHFRQLTPEMLQTLNDLSRTGPALTEAARNHWDRHATQTFDSLGKTVAAKLNVDKLSESQSRKLNAGFVQFLKSNPEQLKPRYDAGDPTLIDEFAKEWFDDFFEPARRLGTLGGIPPVPRVPRGGSGVPLTQGAPQIDYLDTSAVEAEAVRRLREAGHLQER